MEMRALGINFLRVSLSLVCMLCLPAARSTAEDLAATSGPMKPAAVILFGDSIVDPGNNNYINTVIKSNFPPYGKDFIGHIPTGRFSNGKIPGDLIASRLGVKEYVPPYLSQNLGDEELLTGVSFASAASGYDPITPTITLAISMGEQLELFGEYKERMVGVIGKAQAEDVVSRSLFLVCAGANDIDNTYFLSPFRRPHYDLPSYLDLVVAHASDFIQKLYKMGARNIGIVGLAPLGCMPSQIKLAGGSTYFNSNNNNKRECVEARNQAAQLYNFKISAEIKSLAADFRYAKLNYLDIYSMLMDIIQRPTAYGFEVSDKGCCGTGELEVSILCNMYSPVCANDTKYVFWDSYHPTERAYQLVVDFILQKYYKYLF